MKLTILTDNTTRIDAYYVGEPGVSYYLEDGERRILFDTGYSDVYVRNAAALGIRIAEVDTLVFSHGHNDHTRGLLWLPPLSKRAELIAHPALFAPKRFAGEEIGIPMTQAEAAEKFDLHLSKEPVQITQRLLFLGEIPRTNDFESRRPLGERLAGETWVPDFLPDDSALVYRGDDGLTIITGCSHSGICNITDYAMQVCGEERIAGIIGGFHMMAVTPRVKKTVAYLKERQPRQLCPCHCTCFHARAAIHNAVPVREICVGDVLEIR